jgi:hypothetical protein
MSEAAVLNLILFLPVIGMALLVPVRSHALVRQITFWVMVVQFVLTVGLYLKFQAGVPGLQFETRLPWIAAWGVHYHIGLDGFNVLLVLLTAFLGPLVVAGAFSAISKDVKLFYGMVFLIQFTMLGTFLAQDLFLFYVFWEAMLIPMFLIIGIWGGERRIYATVKFVLYTAFGSILMLAAIIYLVYSLQQSTGVTSFSFADLYRHKLPLEAQGWLLAAFALSFAIKVPIVPLHTWLPRRGADRGFGDPGRRAAEDGHLRLHQARLPAVPAGRECRRRMGNAGRRRKHRLRCLPGAGADRHQEDHRVFLDQPPRLRDAGAGEHGSDRHPGRHHPDGEPRPDGGRPVPDGRHDLRALPHTRAGRLRRAGEDPARVLGLLHDPDAGGDRLADHQRVHG